MERIEKEWNGMDRGTNHPYLQRVAELRRTQINVVKSKGILKAHSAAAIRQLTTDHTSDLGVDFTGGGKPENPEKNPRSMRETMQLQQLYSHEFQVFLRINTRLYPGGHPSSYNPVRPGLTWNSVMKSNALTASATDHTSLDLNASRQLALVFYLYFICTVYVEMLIFWLECGTERLPNIFTNRLRNHATFLNPSRKKTKN